jgi:hypothetical protein
VLLKVTEGGGASDGRRPRVTAGVAR